MDYLEIVIGRLEKAARPSRELDGLIAAGFLIELPEDCAGWPPHYTASIDAALALLPDDFHWELKRAPHRRGYFCEAWAVGGKVVAAIGDAASPAMAVCLVAATLHREQIKSPAMATS